MTACIAKCQHTDFPSSLILCLLSWWKREGGGWLHSLPLPHCSCPTCTAVWTPLLREKSFKGGRTLQGGGRNQCSVGILKDRSQHGGPLYSRSLQLQRSGPKLSGFSSAAWLKFNTAFFLCKSGPALKVQDYLFWGFETLSCMWHWSSFDYRHKTVFSERHVEDSECQGKNPFH